MNVFIIAAITADGYIGLDENHLATSWTTKADTRFFVERTKQAGTVVMGRKTFTTINKPLKGRRLIVLTSDTTQIAMDGVEATGDSPRALVARLKKEGVRELAVCGGASMYTQFMAQGLVDELYLTVMPKIFGRGLPIFTEPLDANLELLDTKKLDLNTILLHYKVL